MSTVAAQAFQQESGDPLVARQHLGSVGRRNQRLRLATIGAAALCLQLLSSLGGEADAFTAISQKVGFDTCAAPSQANMDTWWTASPYYNIGIYLGGTNRSCAQPNLTSAWIVHNQTSPRRWGMIPIWVGRQMPNPYCQQYKAYITYVSLTASTAYNQGWNEAAAAYAAAGNLAMDRASMPFVIDLEGYGNGNGSLSTCRAAAKSYVDGWDAYMQAGIPNGAGVYGSQCGSFLNDFRAIPHVPDFIWFGYWNGVASTKNVSANCPLAAADWQTNKRHKQYLGQHNETYSGVTILIDNDCSDGPVYLSTNFLDSGSKCL